MTDLFGQSIRWRWEQHHQRNHTILQNYPEAVLYFPVAELVLENAAHNFGLSGILFFFKTQKFFFPGIQY